MAKTPMSARTRGAVRTRGITAKFPATIEVNFPTRTAMNDFVAKATFDTGLTTRTAGGLVVQVQL